MIYYYKNLNYQAKLNIEGIIIPISKKYNYWLIVLPMPRKKNWMNVSYTTILTILKYSLLFSLIHFQQVNHKIEKIKSCKHT